MFLVSHHNKLWVLYLDCTRGYLQSDMLVAMVYLRNNETCLFLGRIPQPSRVPHKMSFFSLIAGVPDVKSGYYVNQIAPY